MTIAALTRQLKRNDKNLYRNCERLIEWTAIDKDKNRQSSDPATRYLELKLPD